MNIISNIIYSFILGLSGAMMPGPVLAVTITETLKRGFMAAVFIVLGHSLLEFFTVILLSLGVGTVLNNTIAVGIIGIVGGGVLLWMTIGILKESGVGNFDLAGIVLLALSIHAVLLTLNSYDALKEIFIRPMVLINRPLTLFGILGVLLSSVILWMRLSRKKGEIFAEEVNLSEVKSESRMAPFNLGVVISLSNPYWTFWWLTVGLKLVSDAIPGGVPIVSAIYFGHILSDFAWYCLVGAFVVFGRELLSTGAYRWMLAVCGAFLLRFGPYFIYSGGRFLLSV
ncbi:MAG: LysE family transporter [Candidatus Poribacteria bacterium]